MMSRRTANRTRRVPSRREESPRSVSSRRRASSRRRRADIYDMNSDHRQPPYEQYAKGDPEAWAEGRHPSDRWMGEEPRNEMGYGVARPDSGHHSDEVWGEGVYDNKKNEMDMGMGEPPMMASRRNRRNRHQTASIKRKAFRCVKIAKTLLPITASASEIEDQAVELMALSDKAILSTMSRARKTAKVIKAAKGLSAKETKVFRYLLKKAGLKISEELEEADVDEADEAEADEADVDEADVDEADEADVDEADGAEAEEAEGEMDIEMGEDIDLLAEPSLEAPVAEPSLEDEMLNELLESPDLDVEMGTSPMMEEEAPLPEQEYDQVLQGLFDMESGEVKASKKSRKPVKRLGGSVKVASKAGRDDLSGLWNSAPDVSDVFKD